MFVCDRSGFYSISNWLGLNPNMSLYLRGMICNLLHRVWFPMASFTLAYAAVRLSVQINSCWKDAGMDFKTGNDLKYLMFDSMLQ